MPEPVTVPISFFEMTIAYHQPDVRLLGDRTPLIQALMSAWAPFKASLDDIDNLASGKFSEQGLLFKLPSKQIAFFVGATYCRFSRGAMSWDLVADTNPILDLSLSTLASLTNVKLGPKHTTIGMHIQPKVKHFMDILQPFVAPALATLGEGNIRTAAAVARWDERAVTLDGSGSLANAVYLKMERTFSHSASFHDIATQLLVDQRQIYSLMDIEEVRP